MSKSRKRHAQWHNNYIIIIEIVDEKSFRAQTSPSTIIIVWRRYRYDKQSTIIQITGQKRTPDLSPGTIDHYGHMILLLSSLIVIDITIL